MARPKQNPDCCWTCRVRRKRCDGTRPKCGECSNLQIRCSYSERKPPYMDGGRKQKQAAEEVKIEIKRNMRHRREQQNTHSIDSFVVQSLGDFNKSRADSRIRLRETDGMKINSEIADESIFGGASKANERINARITPDAQTRQSSRSSEDESNTTHVNQLDDVSMIPGFSPATEPPVPGEVYETTFLMKYLDFVFPFLFPFYRPEMVGTGRAWILTLVRNSKIALHSVLSLTTYFVTVILVDAYPGGFAPCKMEIWARLGGQTDQCFKMIQTEIQQLNTSRAQANIDQQMRLLGSIMQVLMYQVALGRSDDWSVHLSAAIHLFQDILHHQLGDVNEPTLLALFKSTEKPFWYYQEDDLYLWGDELSGFRFIVALLVLVDVLSSTVLEQPPRLQDLWEILLVDPEYGDPKTDRVRLSLSKIMGCQNWVFIAIGETAALASWKKDMKQAGILSDFKLKARGQVIEHKIHSHLSRMEDCAKDRKPARRTALLRIQTEIRPPAEVSIETASSIWSHAALVYLHVVINGYDPSHEFIRKHVSYTLSLLQMIRSSSYLHTFAWPYCVTGCLAETEEQQEQFKALIKGKAELEVFCTLREAKATMERVWENREEIQANLEEWDFARCANVLGFPVLLV